MIAILDLGLILAGNGANAEGQQAYAAMGGVALGFAVLTGLTSVYMTAKICLGLQTRAVALWQIAGVLPRQCTRILLAHVAVVSLISGGAGAIGAVVLWRPFAAFVQSSGLPSSDAFSRAVPLGAVVPGVVCTVLISLICGAVPARRIGRGDPLSGLTASAGYRTHRRPSPVKSLARLVAGVIVAVGVGMIYFAISRAQPLPTNKVGDFLTSYAGMGMLVCVVGALFGGAVIWSCAALANRIPAPTTSWLLAAGEASSRPALTQAMVLPISLAAAAVGVILAWIDHLTALLSDDGTVGSVSAPPEQLALLVGGPVILACVSAASVVFATASERRRDVALIMVSGARRSVVVGKVFAEVALYAAIGSVIALSIVVVNDLAMARALASGPIPNARPVFPPWQVAWGIGLGFGLSAALIAYTSLTATTERAAKKLIGVDN